MEVHEQLWNTVCESETDEIVESERVYILLRILLDPADLPHLETGRIIQSTFLVY